MAKVNTPPPIFDRPPAAQTKGRAEVDEGVKDFFTAAGAIGAGITGQLLSAVGMGGGMGSGLLGAGGGLPGGLGGLGGGTGGGSYQNMLMLQEKIQREALVYQAQSNISKTAHETKMNAVRNVRP